VKPPYNVNSLTEEKALEILSNMDLINKNIKKINNSRSALIKDLKKIDFVQRIYPSDANFLLIKIDDANKRYQQLIDNNIVVRNRTNDFGCLNCLRITIGTEAENKKLIEVMKSL
jgi:histidinol-phosphate aminotransferase